MSKVLKTIPYCAKSTMPSPATDEGMYVFFDTENSNALTLIKNTSGASTVYCLGKPSAVFNGLLTQASTAAPSKAQDFSSLENSGTLVTYTLARTGAGVYTITASAAVFTAGKTKPFISGVNGAATIEVTSTTVLTVKTYDYAGAAADDVLSATYFSVEVTS